MNKKIKNKGFTILELLVVISIIGIITSVALVTLGAARQKARNTKTVSQVRQYVNAFSQYFNQNGYYPKPTVSNPTCLGVGYDYPAAGQCKIGATTYSVDAAAMTALSTYIVGTPAVNKQVININGNASMGVIYDCSSVDAGGNCITGPNTSITWMLEGNGVSCGPTTLAPTITTEGNTICTGDPGGAR